MKRTPLTRKTPLGRTGALQKHQNTPSVSVQHPAISSPQALTGPAWRNEVWLLDGGRCVMCAKPVRRDASSFVWNAHHCLPKQVLMADGLAAYRYDARVGVVLCTNPCHSRHHGIKPVPLERLPLRALALCRALGPRYEDLLRRYHPPGGAL